MIQIDMQMPKNCLDCPACNEYLMCAIPVNGRGWGENDVREFGQGRPEWCPMKEQKAVEQRTGHWNGSECSNCHAIFVRSVFDKPEYCSHCGAKMEGR